METKKIKMAIFLAKTGIQEVIALKNSGNFNSFQVEMEYDKVSRELSDKYSHQEIFDIIDWIKENEFINKERTLDMFYRVNSYKTMETYKELFIGFDCTKQFKI